MSGYIGTQPVPQATQTRDTFTATASQTSFATSGYEPNFVDVYMNGIKLKNGTDFTASNGSDVVLTAGAAAGDILEVVAFTTYEVNSQNYTGGLTVDNDGATVLTVDRATSDGDIVEFQKDGTTGGSIGVEGGKLYIDSSGGVEGKLKNQGSVSYLWHSDYFTSVDDGGTDLGMSDLRFKDLYLSGGVYLGGTGSANKLDDYEEGTWTPAFQSISTPTYDVQSGTYTKIGNSVHCICRISVTSIDNTDPSGVSVGGFPFVAIDTNEVVLASLGRYTSLLSAKDDAVRNFRLTSSVVLLQEGNNDNIQYANCASSGTLTLAFTYTTSA